MEVFLLANSSEDQWWSYIEAKVGHAPLAIKFLMISMVNSMINA
jgi:hypothetical protein